ncbi:MAG TPA: inositol monophosphatase family protein [Dehalococcoidia bacterium]|nr:inositol monophosphatase family protein [Dehalococcoidia bacterium]
MTLPQSSSGRNVIEVALEAAKRAGEILKAHFREKAQVKYKGRANIVTAIDLKAEDSLKSFLQAEYPDHSIVSEESEPVKGASSYKWILDPLDGTNNYSFGIPFFSTVIALARGDDVLLGIVYDPLRDEMFHAQKGKGAFFNNSPISVTEKTRVQDSLIGLDLGYVDEKGKKTLNLIASIWPNMYAFRIMGSAALGMAYAASGRLDLYIHLLLYPWELACGQLLVTEAGGTVTDWEGKPVAIGEGSVIASNKAIHSDFLRILRAETGV